MNDDHRLIEALPVAFIRTKAERIIYANPAFAALAGVPAAELLGRLATDFVAPEDRERAANRYRARQRGEPAPVLYEVTMLRPDGGTLRVELEPRVLGEADQITLVRPRAGVRDRELLISLGDLSARLQRVRGVDALIAATTAGLASLGQTAALYRLDGEDLVLASMGWPEPHPFAMGGGLVVPGIRFPLSRSPRSTEALRSGRAVFEDDMLGAMARFATGLGETLRAAVPRMQALFAPLSVRGVPWGALVAGSHSLTPEDGAAIGLFAAQLSSMLEVATTVAELERRNRDLGAVQAAAEAGGETEMERVVSRLLTISAEATASASCAIFLLDEAHGDHVLVGAHGFPSSLRAALRHVRVGTSGRDWQQEGSRAFPAAEAHLPWRDSLREHGFLHNLTVPLRAMGRRAGTLWLSRADRPYDADGIASAELLASQVALQLETARLHGDTRRRARDLTSLNELGTRIAGEVEVSAILQAGTDELRKLVDIPAAIVAMVEEGAFRVAASTLPALVGRTFEGEEAPLLQRVVDARKYVSLAGDELGDSAVASALSARTLAGVPLLAGGEAVGVLAFGAANPRTFAQDEVDLALAVAHQLGSALVQARLFEQLRRRVAELDLLLDAAQAVTGTLDLDRLLDISARIATRMVTASNAFVMLLEPGSGDLVAAASSDPEIWNVMRGYRIPANAVSITMRAVRERRPAMEVEITDSSGGYRPLSGRFGARSLLAVPLMARDEPIGALVLMATTPRDWSGPEIERVSGVATQVALAVANARLFEDLKKSYAELARAQKELLSRERLAALGELSALVAHEVRNPLGVIFNSLGSLQKILKPEGDARMLLEIVGEEADRLNRIVGDLLDFARPRDPDLQPGSVAELLDQALIAALSAAGDPGVNVARDVPADLPPVPIDAHMMRQALVNVVLNGVQAMPRGGTLTLRARAEADFLRVDVIDSGPGIPREFAERIFEPFFTTKAAGTGLGLAVVRRIVEAHHGAVEVDSVPGAGARFTLRLPLTGRAA